MRSIFGRLPGEDDDVAGAIAEHPLEEVRRRVDVHFPRRRCLGPAVERGDPFEMLEQIGPERRIHVDTCGHARIHLLLDQRRVEMPGIERHQPKVTHRTTLPLARRDRPAERDRAGHEKHS
jgi:hypothetical protein